MRNPLVSASSAAGLRSNGLNHDPQNPATILFVDDEPSILSALRRLFRPCGYRILMAESGAAALALMDEHAIDLVLSDMRMPEMDGVALLEQVRARSPASTRMLLTGYADIGATISFLAGDSASFITGATIVDSTVDAKRLIREKTVLEDLENAVDQCDSIGDILANLAIKNG